MSPQSPSDTNNYDFFLKPPPPPKNSLLSRLNLSGNRNRLVLALLGGSLLLLIIIALISVIFTKSSTVGLLSLAQQQNELIRVSAEGVASATQQTTKNVAVNIQLSLMTNQQQLLSFMRSHGQNVNKSQLNSTKNAVTDQQLQAATAASDVDTIYLQIIQSSLNTYKQDVKQIFSSSAGSSERQLLNNEYQAASLLTSQAAGAAQTLQNS